MTPSEEKLGSLCIFGTNKSLKLLANDVMVSFSHDPPRSCCISVNAEESFLSRCSNVFLVSAFSCKSMRISSSTSKTCERKMAVVKEKNDSDFNPQFRGCHKTWLRQLVWKCATQLSKRIQSITGINPFTAKGFPVDE